MVEDGNLPVRDAMVRVAQENKGGSTVVLDSC